MPEWAWWVLPTLYCGYIAAHGVGLWQLRRRQVVPTPTPVLPSLSLIVPVRNEGPHLRAHAEQWLGQVYREFTVTVVDDHSSDGAAADLHPDARQQVLALPHDRVGKKAALAHGIAHTHGAWVVTTDGDCYPLGPDWLATLAGGMGPETVCLVGPLRKRHRRSLFEAAQALESVGLVGLAAGAIGLGAPTLVNGANLAFRRTAFDRVAGYAGIDHLASGDDELLVHKLAGAFGGRAVRFVFHPQAIVETPAEQSLPALVRQRLRWVSKGRAYRNPFLRLGQVVAYLGYAVLLVYTLRVAWAPETWPWALGLWALKLLTELSVLYPTARLLGQRYLLWGLPLYQLPYLVYVLYIGVAGSFTRSYDWKDRRVQ